MHIKDIFYMLESIAMLAFFLSRVPALREKSRKQGIPSPVLSLGLNASAKADV